MGTGKTAAIHTVIDAVEDVFVELLNFLSVLRREEIGSAFCLEVSPLLNKIAHHRAVIIGHYPARGFLYQRGYGDAARIVRKAFEVGFLQALVAQNRVHLAVI